MDWNAIGAIAETVGAVGVIITLVYVALQIRQNTKQLRGDAIATVNEAEVTLLRDFRDDMDLVASYVTVSSDWNSGTPQQQVRAQAHLVAWARNCETAYFLWQSDALPEMIYKTREDHLLSIISSPGLRMWWDMCNGIFESNFVSRITIRADKEEVPTSLAHQPWFSAEHWT